MFYILKINEYSSLILLGKKYYIHLFFKFNVKIGRVINFNFTSKFRN